MKNTADFFCFYFDYTWIQSLFIFAEIAFLFCIRNASDYIGRWFTLI